MQRISSVAPHLSGEVREQIYVFKQGGDELKDKVAVVSQNAMEPMHLQSKEISYEFFKLRQTWLKRY